jgi:hypothetical protein
VVVVLEEFQVVQEQREQPIPVVAVAVLKELQQPAQAAQAS